MGGTGGIPKPGLGGLGEQGECPRRFTTNLVDVPQSGNAEYALQLPPGAQLDVIADEARVVVSHEGKEIGTLPPNYSRVAACIELGWSYSASLVAADGTPEDPKIRVAVVGVPG